MSLTNQQKTTLLQVARQSIQHGLMYGKALDININDYEVELREKRATFVTLEKAKQLRGCIGTLTAILPLVSDVAYHAHAAAFNDPRFPALDEIELATLDIHISILSLPEPMTFDSEKDLIQQLRPNIDGLILEEGWHKGTFLPSVWESLPEPQLFLQHLKRKAGLSPHYWSDTIKVERYTTDSFPP